MTKCYLYHATTEEKPKQGDVYHNYKECPDGKRIKPENRVDGMTGRPRCDESIALDNDRREL